MDFEYDYHSEYKLKLKKNNYIKRGLTGLVNMGNKCFMNSIIQSLSNTLSLTDYIITREYKEDVNIKHNEILQSFANLIVNIWDKNELIRPRSFVENTSKYIDKYRYPTQQDSHEFLINILEIIHKAVSYEIEMTIHGSAKTKADFLEKKSLERWFTFYNKEYSIINKLFGGMMLNSVSCNNCNDLDDVFEPYFNISLPIDDCITLSDCFSNYFINENLIEWSCDKCKKNGCNKKISMWSLPDYLIIHLKRFGNNGEKITHNIKYPLDDLDLTKYINSNKCDKSHYIYTLYSVNYHSGNANSGHYWTACKNLDGNWYNYDDESLSKYKNENDVINNNAYILFYYRKKIVNIS
jgi:ubiquitin C-terminal hydrolase